jgi:Alpha/beta hydrolase domain
MYTSWSAKTWMVCATILAISGGSSNTGATPQPAGMVARARAIAAAISDTSPQPKSRITGISLLGSMPVGQFNKVPYTRTFGTVNGIVAPGENVHGLTALDKDADGNYQYTAEFEMIAPAKTGTNSVIVVEAENRGSPVLLGALDDAAAVGPPSSVMYPSGLGNGFLFEHATSYARVQWQYGFAAGVPKNAEGVGEIIMRDFGRLLAGRTKIEPKMSFDPGTYRTLILGGISQSGFYVNTFVAEGFNADPVTGRAVFGGAIAVDGVGAWLALNQLAAENGSNEYPYVLPNGKPLVPTDLLTRPQSDPFYVDIANYTDFYRLRASVTDAAERPERMRRYDWPSPHARLSGGGSGNRAAQCNDGVPVDSNTISYAPYLRAAMLGLEHTLGVAAAKSAAALPPSTSFQLGPAPSDTSHFNPLPGVTIEVPVTDKDDQPIGGVRFPDTVQPTGRPVPVSLSPTVTTSINETCGNLGGWQPFSKAQMAERYGDQANYIKGYRASLDELIAAGYLLSSDREQMLKSAASRYANP